MEGIASRCFFARDRLCDTRARNTRACPSIALLCVGSYSMRRHVCFCRYLLGRPRRFLRAVLRHGLQDNLPPSQGLRLRSPMAIVARVPAGRFVLHLPAHAAESGPALPHVQCVEEPLRICYFRGAAVDVGMFSL